MKKKKKKKRLSAKAKKRIQLLNRFEILMTAGVLFIAFLLIITSLYHGLRNFQEGQKAARHPEAVAALCSSSDGTEVLPAEKGAGGRPEIHQSFLTPNPYSRSQISLKTVKGIVVHYVANPGSSAADNRNYFEGLKDSHATKASSHFVIGLSGEIIQCVPLDEMAYASNRRNKDTISIECCHPGKDGKFSDATVQSLVRLTAWLCKVYGLEASDVIRHYDVTGKLCPLYYVVHEDAWKKFLKNVDAAIRAGMGPDSAA